MHPSLQRLHGAARQAGLTCLSNTWTSWQSRCAFQCQAGHQFVRTANHVIYHGIHCPDCAGELRLAEVRQAAQAKGGQCLETTWLGLGKPHQFQCAHGHTWTARPSKILHDGSWCPHCVRQRHGQKLWRADGLPTLHRIAQDKGGRLLDTLYAGMGAHYRFVCANGHEWQAQGGEIARGSWCKQCANQQKKLAYRLQDGLARLQDAARAKGGECLAQEYVAAKSRYRFRCAKGHEWETTGHRIFRGAWCADCAVERLRLTIEDMRVLAQARGGQCLSQSYRNTMTKLHWECQRGHQWYAVAGAVRRGHWCAACAHLNQITNRESKARRKYLAVRAT